MPADSTRAWRLPQLAWWDAVTLAVVSVSVSLDQIGAGRAVLSYLVAGPPHDRPAACREITRATPRLTNAHSHTRPTGHDLALFDARTRIVWEWFRTVTGVRLRPFWVTFPYHTKYFSVVNLPVKPITTMRVLRLVPGPFVAVYGPRMASVHAHDRASLSSESPPCDRNAAPHGA